MYDIVPEKKVSDIRDRLSGRGSDDKDCARYLMATFDIDVVRSLFFIL